MILIKNPLSHYFAADVAKPWHHSYQDMLHVLCGEAIFEITF